MGEFRFTPHLASLIALAGHVRAGFSPTSSDSERDRTSGKASPPPARSRHPRPPKALEPAVKCKVRPRAGRRRRVRCGRNLRRRSIWKSMGRAESPRCPPRVPAFDDPRIPLAASQIPNIDGVPGAVEGCDAAETFDVVRFENRRKALAALYASWAPTVPELPRSRRKFQISPTNPAPRKGAPRKRPPNGAPGKKGGRRLPRFARKLDRQDRLVVLSPSPPSAVPRTLGKGRKSKKSTGASTPSMVVLAPAVPIRTELSISTLPPLGTQPRRKRDAAPSPPFPMSPARRPPKSRGRMPPLGRIPNPAPKRAFRRRSREGGGIDKSRARDGESAPESVRRPSANQTTTTTLLCWTTAGNGIELVRSVDSSSSSGARRPRCHRRHRPRL